MNSFLNPQIRDVKPIAQCHRPPKLLGDFEQLVLLRLILNNPGIYLHHEIQSKWFTRFGVGVSVQNFERPIDLEKYLGCTRQVMQHVVLQQSDEQKAHFMAEIFTYDPYISIWIDESGCDR